MIYDPIVTLPENCYFLPNEIDIMPCVREYFYFLGKMRYDLLGRTLKDLIIPLFDEQHPTLQGKYLNLGLGEIYDDVQAVFNEEENRDYDVYVVEEEKQNVGELLSTNTPMTYLEMVEALNQLEEGILILAPHGLRHSRFYEWNAEVLVQEQELENGKRKLLTREHLIHEVQSYLFNLKKLEQNEGISITKLFLGYHSPQDEYQTSYGWMFLERISWNQFRNVIDGEIYQRNEFQELYYYPKYLEQHQLEEIYPIYDANLCYQKLRTLKK